MKTKSNNLNALTLPRLLPLFVFLLSFGISTWNGILEFDFKDRIDLSHNSSKSENSLSPFTMDFAVGAITGEKTVKLVSNPSSHTSLNNHFQSVTNFLTHAGRIFLTQYCQYKHLFLGSFILDRKADKLFPFHSFW